ncbi:MAG: hypothetical protein U5K37_06335 [Natrialbaceae archaeon]|nr:hypothetical protein [Natrialbaceae archaeon]
MFLIIEFLIETVDRITAGASSIVKRFVSVPLDGAANLGHGRLDELVELRRDGTVPAGQCVGQRLARAKYCPTVDQLVRT